ncbi:MAG: patatin-like phospholipase family protein [Polyangiaceae bacterium]
MAQIRARVWLDPSGSVYPELELPEIAARPSAGLCLSGGGTRAMVAAVGYLRAFSELGLLDRFRYTSAVSGGSWASIPFTYWRTGARDDRELLGDLLAPEDLDRTRLQAPLPDSYLASCAARSFRDNVFDGLTEEGPARAWNSAVGEVFLAPWGLHDPEARRSYTWSAATRDAIVARQSDLPGAARLSAEDFLLARGGRPFPIVSAALLGPAGLGRHTRLDLVSYEMTPLYSGILKSTAIDYSFEGRAPVHRRVGGGVIEPFAAGGAGPGWMADAAVQTLTLEHPETFADLAFSIGTSSSAFATTMTEKLGASRALSGRVPALSYWPPRAGDVPRSRPWELGDGGTLDNYGLFPLLARGVETIVVLVNTKEKLGLDWTPGEGSYQGQIDAYLPPLFGVHEPQPAIALQRNQVFPREELGSLVSALQDAKRAGGPVMAVREHEVLDNEWLGIRGGRKVRVAWMLLDRVPRFEERLPPQTRAMIGLGNQSAGAGPFGEFPNYKTIGANPWSLVRLEPEQIRLLAALCSWSVMDQRRVLGELLG